MADDTNTTPVNEAEGAVKSEQTASVSAAQPANPYVNAQQLSGLDSQQPAQPYGQAPFSQPYETQSQGYASPQNPTSQDGASQQPYGQPQPVYGQPDQHYGQVPPVNPYQQPPMPQGGVAAGNTDGKATAALVCGILSILFAWTVVPSLILGIVAIVLGAGALRQSPSRQNSKARAGKICGIVGTALSVAIIVFTIFITVVIAKDYSSGAFDNLEYQLETKTSSMVAIDHTVPLEIEGIAIL